jgi:hypothetical protein
MSIELKNIGRYTLENYADLSGDYFTILCYDNERRVLGKPLSFPVSIYRPYVEQEFNVRGKSRGVVSYHYADFEKEHDLTYDEFESNIDYNDEFYAFLQELASEQLQMPYIKSLEEREDYYVDQIKQTNAELGFSRLAVKQKEEIILKLHARIKELESFQYKQVQPQVVEVTQYARVKKQA